MKSDKVNLSEKELARVKRNLELNEMYGGLDEEPIRFPIRLDMRLCADQVVTMERASRHKNIVPLKTDDGKIWNTGISSLTVIPDTIFIGKTEKNIGLEAFGKDLADQIGIWKQANSVVTLKTSISYVFCTFIENYAVYVRMLPSKAFGGVYPLGKKHYDKFEAFIQSLPDYQSQDDLINYHRANAYS